LNACRAMGGERSGGTIARLRADDNYALHNLQRADDMLICLS